MWCGDAARWLKRSWAWMRDLLDAITHHRRKRDAVVEVKRRLHVSLEDGVVTVQEHSWAYEPLAALMPAAV